MKHPFAFLLLATLAASAATSPVTAAPTTTSGSSALALAALVGLHEPGHTAQERHALRRYRDGHSGASFPANKTFHVKAKGVVCRASNVDIAGHSCALTFAASTVNLSGRASHELYATVLENGVPGDGAAGSIFEALGGLDCTLNPHEIAQNGGGGASCGFTPGAP